MSIGIKESTLCISPTSSGIIITYRLCSKFLFRNPPYLPILTRFMIPNDLPEQQQQPIQCEISQKI